MTYHYFLLLGLDVLFCICVAYAVVREQMFLFVINYTALVILHFNRNIFFFVPGMSCYVLFDCGTPNVYKLK